MNNIGLVWSREEGLIVRWFAFLFDRLNGALHLKYLIGGLILSFVHYELLAWWMMMDFLLPVMFSVPPLSRHHFFWSEWVAVSAPILYILQNLLIWYLNSSNNPTRAMIQKIATIFHQHAWGKMVALDCYLVEPTIDWPQFKCETVYDNFLPGLLTFTRFKCILNIDFGHAMTLFE